MGATSSSQPGLARFDFPDHVAWKSEDLASAKALSLPSNQLPVVRKALLIQLDSLRELKKADSTVFAVAELKRK